MKIRFFFCVFALVIFLGFSAASAYENDCGECQIKNSVGDCIPCYQLDRECIRGVCVPRDKSDEGMKELEKAENGDPAGLSALAKICLKQSQYKKALLLYHEAAQKDSGYNFSVGGFLSGFMNNEGIAHELAKGTIPPKYIDLKEAEKFLLEAAPVNDCAKNLLCRIYPMMEEFFRSEYWCRRCIEEGHHESMAAYQLGLLYLHGFGVAKDRAEAIRWFQKSVPYEPAEHVLRGLGEK